MDRLTAHKSPFNGPLSADLWPHPLTAQGRLPALTIAPDAARTLAEAVALIWPDRPTGLPVVVTLDGITIPEASWAVTPVRPGQHMVLRATVAGGDDSNPIAIIATIATVALAAWGGPALVSALGGTALTAAGTPTLASAVASAAIATVGGLVVNSLVPTRDPGGPDSGQGQRRDYSLSGGQNRARPYEPQILVLGRHRVFPDMGAAPWTEFRGDEQYLNLILHFGLGDLEISELSIGPTPFEQFDGATVQILRGERCTWPANVDTQDGQALEDTDWVSRQTSDDTYRLDVDVVASLFSVSKKSGEVGPQDRDFQIRYRPAGSSGAWKTRTINLKSADNPSRGRKPPSESSETQVETRQSDGYSWWRVRTVTEPAWKRERNDIPFRWGGWSDWILESAPPSARSPRDALRRTIRIDLPAPARQWEVEFRRTTEPSSKDNVSDTITVTALRSFQPDTADYTGQTRACVRMRASEQLSGQLPQIHALAQHKIRTSKRGATRRLSRNPAWILLAFLRGEQIGSRLVWGCGLPDSRIDLNAIAAWAAWCAAHTPVLRCDLVLDRATSMARTIRTICQCGRASPTWSSGKLGVVWDAADTPVTALVTPGNVIQGSMSITWANEQPADEIVVSYIDPDADWQQQTLRRAMPGVDAPVTSTTITLEGVTDPKQAALEANLQAARQLYHRRRLAWEMEAEGLAIARGDAIRVSHSLIDGGRTGRLEAVRIDTTGDAMSQIWDPGETLDTSGAAAHYMMLRLPDGRLHTSQVSATPDGMLAPTAPLPSDWKAGDARAQDVIWRFYAADRPPAPMRVTAVEPVSDRRVRIEAIDESALYHAAATSDLTHPLPLPKRQVPRVMDATFSQGPLHDGSAEITLRLTVAGAWRGATVRARQSGTWQVVARLNDGETIATWRVERAGLLEVEIVPGSLAAPTGPIYTTTYRVREIGILPPPEDFTVTVLDDGARRFDWRPLEAEKVAGYRIRYGTAADPAAWTALRALHEGLLTGHPWETRLPPEGRWRFAIVAVAPDGQEGVPAFIAPTDLPAAVKLPTTQYAFLATAAATPPPRPGFGTGQVTDDDYVPPGWSREPVGVSEALPFQWIVERKGRTGGGPWTAWSTPTLWSNLGKPGKTGLDGPGVEFIFRRTAKESRPQTPTTTELQDAIDDFVPNGWTDNATGVTADLPYLWASKREGSTGNWLKFQIPVLWARYSGDGATTQYAFLATVAPTPPPRPGTGTGQVSDDDYVPPGWSRDPVGVSAARKYQWIVERKGRLGGGPWSAWTEPSLWSSYGETGEIGQPGKDGPGIEYIFRALSFTRPATPNGDPTRDDDTPGAWTDNAVGLSAENPILWMSRRVGSSGNWGPFSTPVVWARWSKDGADGPGVEFIFREGSYTRPATPGTNAAQRKMDDYVPNNWSDNPEGVSAENPRLWMSRRVGSSGNWGPFSTPVVWARYSRDGADGSDGADGAGIEYIFRQTATESAPDRPLQTAAQRKMDDFIPYGWTDDATGVSPQRPILWMSRRTGTSGNWGPFSYPVVWARYARDGQDGGVGRDGPRGPRGAGFFAAATSGTSWSTSVANSVTPGDNVEWDRVTLYNIRAEWSETRTWRNGAWRAAAQFIDGNAIVDGTVFARALDTDSLSVKGLGIFGSAVQSTNYVPNSDTGWRIELDGSARFNGPVISRKIVLNEGNFQWSGTLKPGDEFKFVNSGIKMGKNDVWRASRDTVIISAAITSTVSADGNIDEDNSFWGLEAYPIVGAKWYGYTRGKPPSKIWNRDPRTTTTWPGVRQTDQRLFFNIRFHASTSRIFVKNPRIQWKVFQVT